MRPTRPTSSASLSSTPSSASNGTKPSPSVLSSSSKASSSLMSPPPLKTKTLPTPSKPGLKTSTPAKTPLKAEKHEAPKPVSTVEACLYVIRQLLEDETPDANRDALIRNKLTESGLSLDEEVARARARIAGPCEAARAESQQIQEDTRKETSILRRKCIEEVSKNERLQQEVEQLKKVVQDVSHKLVYTEHSLTIERNHVRVLLENVTNVERESMIASRALENTMSIINALRQPAITPVEHANLVVQYSSPSSSSFPPSPSPSSSEVVNQRVVDAENAIKNLTDILRNTDTLSVQEGLADLKIDIKEGGEERDTADANAHVGGNDHADVDHVEKEVDSDSDYSDDEVVHISINGNRHTTHRADDQRADNQEEDDHSPADEDGVEADEDGVEAAEKPEH